MRSIRIDLGSLILYIDMYQSVSNHCTLLLANMKEICEIYTLVDGEPIGVINECKYLGQTLSFTDKTRKELNIRRANGWNGFW